MKFLKSMALTFPFSLVTCPLGVPVAILHGIGFGAWMFLVELPLLILGSLGPILMFTLKSPFMLARGVAKYRKEIVEDLGVFALSLIAAPSVISRANNTPQGGRRPTVGAVAGALAAVYGVFGSAVVATFYYFPLASENVHSDPYHNFLRQHPMPFMALGVCQLFSLIYELGKNYWTSGAKPSQPEIPEAKVVAPQSHLTMFSKIQDKDKISEEEAWTFLREAVDIGKNGKMKLGDVDHLVKMISARAPTPAVVH